jgi:hypothetical protein
MEVVDEGRASRVPGSYQNYQKSAVSDQLRRSKYVRGNSGPVFACHAGYAEVFCTFYSLKVSKHKPTSPENEKYKYDVTDTPLYMMEVIGCTYTCKGVIFYQSPYF